MSALVEMSDEFDPISASAPAEPDADGSALGAAAGVGREADQPSPARLARRNV